MKKETIEKAFDFIDGCHWISERDKRFLKEVVKDEYSRESLLSWNQNNDRNGCYLDKNVIQEYGEEYIFTYEEIKARTLVAFEISQEVIESLDLVYVW